MELQDVQVLAEGLEFPEGPVVLPDGSVAVVEIIGKRVTRVGLDGTRETIAVVGGGPNGAALGPDGALYIANNGGYRGFPVVEQASIQRVDMEHGTYEVIYTECDGRPFTGPNDLVFDRTGSFWFTDHDGDSIYYAAADGSSCILGIAGVDRPNGIGLSADESTLYWAQTRTRQVMKRRLSGPGQMVPSPGYSVEALLIHGSTDRDALLVGLPGAEELDSLAIDSSGSVCVGTLVEGGITVISPDGQIVEKWVLPDELNDDVITNICFGGPDLQTAYITASLSGRLISCRWPRPGLALAF